MAAMISDPIHLKELAKTWDVREEDLRVLIRDGMYDMNVKHAGMKIFDRVEESSKRINSLESRFSKAVNDLPSSLSERQRSILNQLQQNVPYAEIAKNLNISVGYLKEIVVQIRHTAEDKFIFPSKFKRGTSYHQQSIITALSKGRLEGVKYLNIWYTEDKVVKEYRRLRQRTVNKSLLRMGFIPLASAVSPREYKTYVAGGKYQKYLRREDRRIYVHVDEIDTIKSIRNEHPFTKNEG